MATIHSADGTALVFDVQGDGPALLLVDGALCVRSTGSKPELIRTRRAGSPCWEMIESDPEAARSAAACGDASTGVMLSWPPPAVSRAGLTGGKTIEELTRAA